MDVKTSVKRRGKAVVGIGLYLIIIIFGLSHEFKDLWLFSNQSCHFSACCCGCLPSFPPFSEYKNCKQNNNKKSNSEAYIYIYLDRSCPRIHESVLSAHNKAIVSEHEWRESLVGDTFTNEWLYHGHLVEFGTLIELSKIGHYGWHARRSHRTGCLLTTTTTTTAINNIISVRTRTNVIDHLWGAASSDCVSVGFLVTVEYDLWAFATAATAMLLFACRCRLIAWQARAVVVTVHSFVLSEYSFLIYFLFLYMLLNNFNSKFLSIFEFKKKKKRAVNHTYHYLTN